MNATAEPILRLLALLVGGAVCAFSMAALLVARSVLTPRRATAGWALARGLAVDPSALGLAWREVGDSSLRVWRIVGRGGNNGPALLLLHGWNRSRIDSLRRVGPLLDDCSVAYLPDLPGHGDSAGTTSVGASEHLTLLRFLDDRAEEWENSGLIIAGHSLGAVVGLHLAAALATREHGGTKFQDRRHPLAVIAWAPYERAVQPMAARLRLHSIAIPLLAESAHAVLRLRTGSAPPTQQALAAVAACGIPVLLVSGEHDRIVPPSIVASLARSGGDTTRVLHGAADHAELGTASDETTSAAVDWLRSIRASG